MSWFSMEDTTLLLRPHPPSISSSNGRDGPAPTVERNPKSIHGWPSGHAGRGMKLKPPQQRSPAGPRGKDGCRTTRREGHHAPTIIPKTPQLLKAVFPASP